MRHTPGPWQAHWNEQNKRTHTGRWYWVAPNQKFPGHTVNVWTDGRNGEAEANAHLIAAAPELLQQLEALVVQIEHSHMIVPPNVRAVIAKAKGEVS